MNTSLPPVLAAEDEETDGLLLRLAFEQAGLNHPLIVVRDGEEAVDYLSGHKPYDDRTAHPLPVLLLLDLKMPRMTGFDVLAWLAARREFKDLPAVVVSSSSHEIDIQRAREMGARDYIVKPHAFSEFVRIIKGLHVRWLAETPSEPEARALSSAAA